VTGAGTHPTVDLGVYALGVLPPDEENRLRKHLHNCTICRLRLDDLEGISELLSAARIAPRPDPSIADIVLTSLPPQRSTNTEHACNRTSGAPSEPSEATARPEIHLFKTARSHLAHQQPATAPPEVIVLGRQPVWSRPAVRVAFKAILSLVAVGVVVVAAALIANRQTTPPVDSIPLRPGSEISASGRLTVANTQTGTALTVSVRGLAPGSYVATVATGSTLVPAGSFRVPPGADTTTVVLHCAARTGRFQIAAAGEPEASLLNARLPG
jgi:hypothetical protein